MKKNGAFSLRRGGIVFSAGLKLERKYEGQSRLG
jgi:hypothetical protein